MYTGDIVIHILEELDNDRIQDLERKMGYTPGVFSASMHERTRHLMVVDFDATAVRPSGIVKAVRSHGLHADMIGL